MENGSELKSIIVQVTSQFKYEGQIHRRRELVAVTSRLAQHLIDQRKAKIMALMRPLAQC